ncbi:MAG: transglycosylase SLT domain-containing protein [Deltaproteobacteria bacterium]|nr:transglycosylase SLT domain-containing protein [Deltaproteobacteria bacterium]
MALMLGGWAEATPVKAAVVKTKVAVVKTKAAVVKAKAVVVKTKAVVVKTKAVVVKAAPTIAKEDPNTALIRFERQTFPRPLPIPTLLGVPDLAKLAAPARPPRPLASTSRGSLLAGAPATRRSAPQPDWALRLTLPDLPVRWHGRVLKYLEFYKKSRRGQAIMRTWIKRMGRYASSIEGMLAKRGAPRALIYVAMIESGFNPRRTSRAGAAGLWQFMPRTGRGFGLQRSHWVDERRDPRRSTEAAAQYLLSLYRRFNSWHLALAAYNAGYGTVLRAIRKYNTNDYWQLCEYEAALPWSTTLYVAKILAAAIVGENPAYFGFSDVQPDAALSFDLVSAPRSLTLAQLARASGASIKTLQTLNPELRRGRTPPSKRSWVRVPTGSTKRFYASLGALGKLRYRPYAVVAGESLASIARRHRTSTSTLRRINGLRSEREVRPGLVLLVPARPRAHSTAKQNKAPQEPQIIALPPRGPTELEGRKRVFYRVVLGDTLAEIGQRLGVSADELARWNDVDRSARLISQMVLQAFITADQDVSGIRLLHGRDIKIVLTGGQEFLELHESRRGRRRVIYTVRKGDTLQRISRRFKLSVGSLARINRFSRSHKVQQGEKVTLYLDKKHARQKKKGRTSKTSRRSAKKTSAKKPPKGKPPLKSLQGKSKAARTKSSLGGKSKAAAAKK